MNDLDSNLSQIKLACYLYRSACTIPHSSELPLILISREKEHICISSWSKLAVSFRQQIREITL